MTSNNHHNFLSLSSIAVVLELTYSIGNGLSVACGVTWRVANLQNTRETEENIRYWILGVLITQ